MGKQVMDPLSIENRSSRYKSNNNALAYAVGYSNHLYRNVVRAHIHALPPTGHYPRSDIERT